MRRIQLPAGVLLVLAILAASGCYTVLRHPTGSDDVVRQGSYYRGCADCHAEAQFYHPYYRYGRSHYRWNDYYGYPWWYDDYWWWDNDDEGGEPSEIERGRRHMWGSGGWASSGWGFTKPSGTSPPRTTPPPEDEAVDDGKQPEPKDDGESEGADTRHLWKGKKKGF